VNRQIRVEESKYRVTSDPHLQVIKGSRDLLLKFWDPLHILGTVGARELETSNLAGRLTTGIANERNVKLGQRGSRRGHVTYF